MHNSILLAKHRKEEKMANLPFFLMFCIFPFVSIFAKLMGLGMLNYDVFWVLAFCLSCMPIPRMHSRFHEMFVVLSVLLLFKYFFPLIVYENIVYKAWLMDIKWLLYLLFCIFWISKHGNPDCEKIYKYSLFFSYIYILFTIFRYIVLKEDVSRDGILMEANYDGFMILMGFCFFDSFKKKKTDFFIFFVATLCTMSRTGLIAFFIMIMFRYLRKNVLYIIPLVPILLFAAEYAMLVRGVDSASHLDRFVYFEQAYRYFQNTDIYSILLGNTPGKAIKMHVIPEFEWNVSNFENMRNLKGVFPFMFHSVYLRLALTWGIIVPIAYACFFVYHFFKSKGRHFQLFCLLTIIQSISLSTMTLQNVSVMFFMILFTFLYKEKYKCYDSSQNSLLLAK